MPEFVNRRDFLKHSAALGTGAAIGLGAGTVRADDNASNILPSVKDMPMGQIGKLKISRLISGGNLISGWAHARDLRYVSELQRRYNTKEKVLETLALCEANGINTIIADPRDKPMEIFKKHWDMGGKIQWIAEGHPTPNDLFSNVQKSIDWGASAIYVQGVIGDRWLRDGHIDKLAKVVDYVKKQGMPAGIGAHLLDVIIASETSGYKPDFYVKTLHHGNYWSARRPDQQLDVVANPTDNYWSMTPEETIEFFKNVKTPWIAFKTLAAGAIHPNSGFDYAFKGGADFVCVGMFDFQVTEDAQIAKDITEKYRQRSRPWRA
ncbi:MAG: twin-arginine translocation signal domain-containing protein [Sedimentisphaerales bacterium]|nr:twin-arginine translocation signal domain-containing protein [Sedimentisphaerales bacterium]